MMKDTMNIALSMRTCPKCGAKNGLETQKMVGHKRAKKQCRSCGHICVVNYKTRKLEEYEEE